MWFRSKLLLLPVALLLPSCGGGNKASSINPGANTVRAQVTTQGGSVEIPKTAKISFPANSFPTVQTVELSTTSDADTANEFAVTAALFQPTAKLAYEVRVNTGSVAPNSSFQISLQVPDTFASTVPANSGIEAFVQMWQDAGEDSLDSFELVDSSYDASSKTILLTLPKEAFTNKRRVDGTYELVATLAATPGTRTRSAQSLTRGGSDPSVCYGSSLGPPLARTIETSRRFNRAGETHPITGQKTPHYGTDFRASNGDNVLAVSDGYIEEISYQYNPEKKTGWGHYIRLRHGSGEQTLTWSGATQYAHLKEGSILVTKGQIVRKGDVIAQAGSSGGATGPHLHLEYVPNGEIFENKNKVDPYPCIGTTLDGSINVADIGPDYDDIFEVTLGGIVLGRTDQGGSNNFAAFSLRPGTYTLNILCILDGTQGRAAFGITLSNGLQFADGSVSASGIIDEGGSSSYTVIVPASGKVARQHPVMPRYTGSRSGGRIP